MKKLFNLLKWKISRGKDSQNFLGASWIPRFLSAVPERSKRKWALRILSLSPHYFIKPDLPKFQGMSFDEYLESSLADIVRSREEIYERVFKAPLGDASVVLDYGCGPGFLAKVAARERKTVYAVDISNGALACGRIINADDAIHFLLADEAGISSIPDKGVDAVMSLAVVQHLTDEVLSLVLDNCRTKLREAGTLTLHVQMQSGAWKSETDWRDDASLQGRLKFSFGLHCFGRTPEAFEAMLKEKGFANIAFTKLSDLMLSDEDNDGSEFLVTATKA